MLTDEQVLAAYAVGNDLHEVAPVLRQRFQSFIADCRWPSEQVVFVDQVHDPDPAFPDWPPDWDLGLNLGLDSLLGAPDWFSAIKELVEFLEGLHGETGWAFVLFLCFRSRPWLQEELLSIGGVPVDLPWLQGAISRLTLRSS